MLWGYIVLIAEGNALFLLMCFILDVCFKRGGNVVYFGL